MTFKNPYARLGAPKLENPAGEEVGGSFACQERGCRSIVGDAIYLQEISVLTWKCGEGHTNKIEGFNIG